MRNKKPRIGMAMQCICHWSVEKMDIWISGRKDNIYELKDIL